MTKGGGYTIIETMIFLAITLVLFGSAMSVMSGRQSSVQFTQSVRDSQSKLTDIINQVSTGYYRNDGTFTCNVTGNSAPTFDTSTPSPQGTSTSCIFLGKAIKFNSGATADKYSVFSIAARRVTPTNKEVGSLLEALPTPISPLTLGDGRPDMTEDLSLEFGLSVTRIVVEDDAAPRPSYGAIVFLSTLPAFQASTGTLASGSQRVSYAAVRGSLLADSKLAAATRLSSINDTNITQNPRSGITVCLANDSNVANATKKAMLTIGEGASQTAVRLETGFYNEALCES